jgi:hypothetical protein
MPLVPVKIESAGIVHTGRCARCGRTCEVVGQMTPAKAAKAVMAEVLAGCPEKGKHAHVHDTLPDGVRLEWDAPGGKRLRAWPAGRLVETVNGVIRPSSPVQPTIYVRYTPAGAKAVRDVHDGLVHAGYRKVVMAPEPEEGAGLGRQERVRDLLEPGAGPEGG